MRVELYTTSVSYGLHCRLSCTHSFASLISVSDRHAGPFIRECCCLLLVVIELAKVKLATHKWQASYMLQALHCDLHSDSAAQLFTNTRILRHVAIVFTTLQSFKFDPYTKVFLNCVFSSLAYSLIYADHLNCLLGSISPHIKQYYHSIHFRPVARIF